MKRKLSVQFIVWVSLTVVSLTATVTASLVATKVPFLYGTICSVLGGERRKISTNSNGEDYERFKSDYENKAQVLDAANSLNEEICEEGFTLLKNDGVLPLQKGKKISVFGKNSVNLVLGGSGSNAGGSSGKNSKTVYSSLSDAGFVVNPIMKSFYESDSTSRPQAPGMGSILTGFPISETPLSSYSTEVKNSYSQYNDLALVVISRIGGEGFDLPRTMMWNGSNYTTWNGANSLIPGARNKTDHYLQLDQNETDMLKEANDNFDNVVVVINSANTIELGFLDDVNHYAYQPNIKGALWVGTPGNSGIGALGKILNGEVNPSGRTVDLYARDFKNDPTWNNFGNNLREDGNRYFCEKIRNAWTVEYEEGIYTGYRYYETRDFVEKSHNNNDWYKQNVVYPFGYGLSYTDFEWTVTPRTQNNSVIDDVSELIFDVKVKNNGNVSGKDVVELYYTAPYFDGGIEKAHVVLKDFVKSNLLAPGAEETYQLSLKTRDMASYDYNDANNNNFKGYELEVGEYEIKIMKNSHEPVSTFKYNLNNAIRYENDEVTNTPIVNQFDDVSNHITKYLSRSDFDGTWPTMMTAEELVVSTDFISTLTYRNNDKESDPWYSATSPNQSTRVLDKKEIKHQLYELIGADYNDPKWDELLDQLTVDQMASLIKTGEYRTTAIINIGKPLTTDADGPMGFAVFMGDPKIYDTCYYAGEIVVAATFNIDLVEKMGEMVGNEGIIGNEKGDGSPYSGWYAPAMNLHRSQFGGRNFEYYSEDPFLSGEMATSIVKGTNKKGVYAYCKHFALNEQETNRDSSGLITWANEQAMRENYFLPFEMVTKNGKATAMMSAFNRLGSIWAGGNYNLLTNVLRKEWGFVGMVITDFNLTEYMNVDQMLRAGGDISLSADKKIKDTTSPTAVTALRRATKNVLYTVANSNAMNGIGEGVELSYKLPYWVIGVIAINIAVGSAFGIWGLVMFLTKTHLRRKKNEKEA